jgi:DNA topoisomerase-3
MSKALIIGEKPSVAADIARALGGFTKHQDYFESETFVLSSAVGHLLELRAPEQYDVKRGKWSFNNLPVIPPHFDLQPIERSEPRLKALTKLIKRKDVTALVNACDAGREGELIFRYIVQHTKAKQPIRRLWLQSMTPASIREAFAQLRSDMEMQPLADAARCRSEADWLVGINGTRAMTAFNSKDGGFFLTTVGRVQTPTLAIVVEREERIQQFVPRDYWEVRATFGCRAGEYEGRWFDPDFKKVDDDPDRRPERLWEQARADAIAAACRGKSGTVSEESKPSTQAAPLLFDLTSLQREGNSRFGFSAKTTLSLAQALYERHKVLTYPRTDSRALPEDYVGVVKKTVDALGALRSYAPFTKQIGKNGWVKPNKRVFDNSKISDHFAIIPTLEIPKHLSEAEHKIYDLVVKRFLAIFFPSAEYLVTTRVTTVEQHQFKTEGKVLVEAGWLAIYGKEAQEAEASLVKVEPNEKVRTQAIEAIALQTKPPPRYSEATLLSAMEGAGKLVDDDELRAAMAGKGLGTPATRAAIIEGLITEAYLAREGRELHPTAKAFQLLRALRGFGVDALDAPELTGEWEHKLAQMERGRLKRESFMREIAHMTRDIVERIRRGADTGDVPGDYAKLKAPCPNCGGKVEENYRRFACTRCDFSISKHPGGRFFETNEVEQLLREKQIGPLTGFRSKMGRPFAAVLKISPEHKLEFDFGNAAPGDDGASEPIDFSGQTPLGPCPKCRSNVYEQPMAYVCEKSVGPERSCDFRASKVILQQPLEPDQARKLLAEGRTELLRGFVSNRTRRKFAAFLITKPDGTIGFEFEPRAPRGAAKAGAKTAAKSPSPARAEEPHAPAPVVKKRAVPTTAPEPDAPRTTAHAPAKSAAKTVTRTVTKASAKSAAKSTPARKAAPSTATRKPTAKASKTTRRSSR